MTDDERLVRDGYAEHFVTSSPEQYQYQYVSAASVYIGTTYGDR